MPIRLPWPYLPGTNKPDSFEDHVQQNFDALATSVGDFGGSSPKFRWGYVAAPFSAAAFVNKTVLHGLGVVPASIQVTVRSNTGTNPFFARVDTVTPPTSTQFVVQLNPSTGAAVTDASPGFYWIAIG